MGKRLRRVVESEMMVALVVSADEDSVDTGLTVHVRLVFQGSILVLPCFSSCQR